MGVFFVWFDLDDDLFDVFVVRFGVFDLEMNMVG